MKLEFILKSITAFVLIMIMITEVSTATTKRSVPKKATVRNGRKPPPRTTPKRSPPKGKTKPTHSPSKGKTNPTNFPFRENAPAPPGALNSPMPGPENDLTQVLKSDINVEDENYDIGPDTAIQKFKYKSRDSKSTNKHFEESFEYSYSN